jgi:hypothetical protein
MLVRIGQRWQQNLIGLNESLTSLIVSIRERLLKFILIVGIRSRKQIFFSTPIAHDLSM